MPEPRTMSRDHLTPAVKGQTSAPRWTPNLVAGLPGLSPAFVTPTQPAIAVIKSSRGCHYLGASLSLGKGGEGGEGHVIHTEVIRRCFYPVWQNQEMSCPIYINGIFYLRFPVVDSPAVRCLLLFPRENSKLCKSSSQVLLNCKPARSLICALKGEPATDWTSCEWSC